MKSTTNSKDQKASADKKVKAAPTKASTTAVQEKPAAKTQTKSAPVAEKQVAEKQVAEQQVAEKAVKDTATREAIKGDKQPVITYEEISRKAYYLWMQRGGTHGFDVQDWLTAEKELVKSGR